LHSEKTLNNKIHWYFSSFQ